jgi:dihydrofolate synthase / folylpolyglutamate synthase
MSLAEEIGRIASEYPGRTARSSLEAAARLRDRCGTAAPLPVIGVVGTNGKTSTATYLARLLSASGARTGLYVSPHLTDWTERIRIDDEPCDLEELLEVLTAVHEVAASSGDLADLRFFDILTLAAERIVGKAGVDVAVFEAGIGGRLDAVRLLEPRIVLLTGVAIDHAEMLGEEPGEILREKLLVASPGATVLSFRLGAELDELADQIAAERELQMHWVDPDPGVAVELPAYLRSALTLAEEGERVAAQIIGTAEPRAPGFWTRQSHIDLRLAGRFECGERDGAPYVLDAAHNEDAWYMLAFELRRQFGDSLETFPYTVLVSVSPSKRRDGLAAALNTIPRLESLIVTRHTGMPAEDPRRLAEELTAAGLEARPVEDVDAAAAMAFERGRTLEERVLVFGSTHLVGDVRRWLTRVGASSEGD